MRRTRVNGPRIVLAAIVVAAILGVAFATMQQPVLMSGYVETQCAPLVMEGTQCSADSDCLAELPSDMPGDVMSVGELSCVESVCHFIPYSCEVGLHEAG